MSWTQVELSKIIEINPRIPLANDIDSEQLVSFVPMASVSDTTYCIEVEQERLLSEVRKGFTPFKNEDVIVAKITPCFENGKMALVDIKHELGFGSTEFHVLRADINQLLPKYLYHFVRRDEIRSMGEKRMTGSAGQRRVPKAFWEHLQIPLPPLAEQQRIAAILDKADELRAKRRAALAKLDTLLQSTFFHMFGDPVTNPMGWEVGKIGDLAKSVNYGTSKKADVEGEIPIIRMGNITYEGGWDFSSLKYIDFDEEEKRKYLVHKGEILFNRTNSKELVGKTAVYREESPMAFAGYLVRLVTNSKAEPEYISAFMNTPQTKQYLEEKCKSIVGMANINAKEFQAIKIPIPPLALQNKYSVFIDGVLKQKKLQAKLAKFHDNLFHALQQRAFKGEL